MNQNFLEIFTKLKSIFKEYEDEMVLLANTKDKYYLIAGYSEKWNRDIWFGGVQIMKNYVSFHFVPGYMYPELFENLSEELKKHLPGKACFNFKTVDEKMYKELKNLVKDGYKKFAKESLINKTVNEVK